MRDVAIVSFARLPPAPALPDHSEVELVAPVVTGALDARLRANLASLSCEAPPCSAFAPQRT